jgi:hypothetical protein
VDAIPWISTRRGRAITTPGGARVAWMRDPDGNLLSVVQYA